MDDLNMDGGYAEQVEAETTSAQDRELELVEMRNRVIEHNKETIQKLLNRGATPDGSFAVGARIEALIDLLIPVGVPRAQFNLSVEVHLGIAFERALEQVEKQSSLIVPGS